MTIGENYKGYAQLAILNRHGDCDNIGEIYNSDSSTSNKMVEIDGQYPPIKLLDIKNNSETGYQGYLYQNLETGELYIVHGGSQSLEPGDAPLSDLNKSETINDYINNVGYSLATGDIPPQFEDAYNFLHEVQSNPQYANCTKIQIGQSLGGKLAELTGALYLFKDIETITFNAVGAGLLLNKLAQYGTENTDFITTLSDDYSNISNYRYSGEFVSTIAPHIGNVYTVEEYINNAEGVNKLHNMELYIINDNLEFMLSNDPTILGVLQPIGGSITTDIVLGKLAFIICPPVGVSTATLSATISILDSIFNETTTGQANVIKGYVSIDNVVYDIQQGDTIWDVCQKYGLTHDKLIEANPWLADRFSDDMEFALIKPEEQLYIPENVLRGSVSYDESFETVRDIYTGEKSPSDLIDYEIPEDSEFYVPQGGESQEITYQYTQAPAVDAKTLTMQILSGLSIVTNGQVLMYLQYPQLFPQANEYMKNFAGLPSLPSVAQTMPLGIPMVSL